MPRSNRANDPGICVVRCDRLGHHRRVRVQRDKKAAIERVLVDLTEVASGENFAAGERQPEHARALDDVEHTSGLVRREIRALIRIERDVTELTAEVTSRRDLEQA
jgi:hypothetical protein